MALNSSLKTASILVGVVFCSLAGAENMYRCGSVYQDRPCEGKQQGKMIGSTGAAQSSHQPVADAVCAQRGADALKIVWAREGGASAAKQISDIDAKRPYSPGSAEQKRLVADVFNKRGSAPEIRSAIEADCMLEKERDAQAAALISAARAMPGTPQSRGAPTHAQNSDEATKAADERSREDGAARDAASKKSRY